MGVENEQRKRELLQLLQGVSPGKPASVTNPAPEGVSDQELIARCQHGDRAALTQVLNRYQQTVYTYITQVVHDETAALRLTCAVFVTAYKRIARVHDTLPFKTWLLQIAERHVLRHALRQQGTWYAAYVPIRLYQWYQQRIEPLESHAEKATTDQNECQPIRSLLSAYIDDELSEPERSQVDAHLESCQPCCIELERLRDTVEIVQTFGATSAPANVRVQVNAILDHPPLWERVLTYVSDSPIPQIVAVAATVAIVFLGILASSQSTRLRQMEAQLRTVRAIVGVSPETFPTTFVIFTGKMATEEIPVEAGEVVSAFISDPAQTETRFLPGNITAVSDRLMAYLRDLYGQITEDQTFPKGGFTIRKIRVDLPHTSPEVLALFFQHTETPLSAPVTNSDRTTVTVTIYLIEKKEL